MSWHPTTLEVRVRRYQCTDCSHVWRRGSKYVTVIIGLTPVRDKTGPSRLLDMVPGNTKEAFKTWLASRPRPWRDALEVAAMVSRKR